MPTTATLALLLLLGLPSWARLSNEEARVMPRDDCRTVTVADGDGCSSLAQKCGISGDDFTKYNSNPNPCGSLVKGQLVCCSAGTKPNRRPIQNWDGTCLAYVVQQGDTCASIAASRDLTVQDLYTFNDKTTWGWQGCESDRFQAQTAICLSTGTPPLPPPVENAICGPTKPGTKQPTGGTLADLNPCPLNTCCNKWGQCGTTPEFCSADAGPRGNPGTAPPGKNGCISNCGVYFANIRTPPRQINVGYYESWNFERPCLTMRVSDVNTQAYTHIHWAFADVSSRDFTLSITDKGGQFEKFKALKDVKRIISIGGWSFSTLPATYDTLRRAMTGANAQQFADNIIWFLNVHGLDGIDIDWEYPGAPDNQGVSTLPPTGSPNDGFNYWAFLYILRQRMPAGKSISIAAPSSYWYLKSFPISAMKDQVDYIVYMTYDLHGQWDYNNKWAVDGCPAGNCLRSHVNLTETIYALSMVTKAGVPTDKLVVGISSYGRSFGMTDVGCDGSMCTYKGPASAATPGRCTKEPGYISNAEIKELKNQGGFGWKSWHDQASDSDMFVYGAAQWVAYMSDETRQNRKNLWKAWQFAGTADWAIDLLEFKERDGDPNTPSPPSPPPPTRPTPPLAPTGITPQESPVVTFNDDNLSFYNLTVINATPYDWRRDYYGDPYRMWGFKEVWPETINAGSSITVTYGSKQGQDDAGDIKYKLDINGRKEKAIWLQVHGRQNGPNSGVETLAAMYGGLTTPGHSADAQLWPIGLYYQIDGRGNQGGRDSWILSGNEQDGYYSTDPPVDWMNIMGDRLKKLSLQQIMLPGSHDSGSYQVSVSNGAVERNSVTQSVDIYTQLERGMRALDFRIFYYRDEYWLGHGAFSNILAVKLPDAIENINRFRRDHPGELIIIQINQMSRSIDFEIPYDNLMSPELAKACFQLIWNSLDGVQTKYKLGGNIASDADIGGQPLTSYYSKNNSPVLVRIKDEFIQNVGGSNVAGFGIVNSETSGMISSANLRNTGTYANSQDAGTMRSDQFLKLTDPGYMTAEDRWRNDAVHETSMTLTLQGIDNAGVLSIKSISEDAHGVMYDSIYRWAKETGRYPNLLWSDFVNNKQVAGIAMAVNYQFAYKRAGVL